MYVYELDCRSTVQYSCMLDIDYTDTGNQAIRQIKTPSLRLQQTIWRCDASWHPDLIAHYHVEQQQ